MKTLDEFSDELDMPKEQTRQLLKKGRVPHIKLSNKTILIKDETEVEDMKPDDLMTMRDLAKMLKVSVPTIYSWVKARKIPFIKIGERSIRFKVSEIDQFLQEHTFGNFT
jgi:excisionase family DNA binding protein